MQELDEILAGRLEPLKSRYVDLQKGRPGTRLSPIPVPSDVGERLVGCACGDNDAVEWVVAKQGHVSECGNCGNCFQLVLKSQNDDVTMTSSR